MSYAQQSEILFIWDGDNWNPNGDMLNSNAPRYDEISRKALVSDVRIKRTIRDYLYATGNEIFVREDRADQGGITDAKERGFHHLQSVGIASENEYRELLKKANSDNEAYKKIIEYFLRLIDVRAFGAVVPSYGKFTPNEKNTHLQSFNLTGAIQWKMSKSINQTEIIFDRGTGGFASVSGDQQKTFREEYRLPYAVFATYGIINALNSAKTKLSESDVQTITDALWFGTKNLITRSKFGQLPRFLLKITYKEAGHFIGGLDNLVTLSTSKASENEIGGIGEYSLSLQRIIDACEQHNEAIEKIEYITDGNITIEAIPSTWIHKPIGI